MEWTPRVVLPFVGLFVLLTTCVIIAILRLSGLIAWPSRWVAIALIVLLLVPVALLLVAATRDEGQTLGDAFTALLNGFLPPW